METHLRIVDRSFEVSYPFFALCGALHMEDVAHLFVDGDPLGSRVAPFYSRLAFHKAADIKAANDKLGAGNLADQVPCMLFVFFLLWSSLFWVLCFFLRVGSHGRSRLSCGLATLHTTPCGVAKSALRKDPFRVYSLSPDAAVVFEEGFDHHVVKQQEAHLVDQERAKYHGKAKTKHLRLALALYLFEPVFACRTAENWSVVLDTQHLVAANALGKYLDR